MATTQEILDRLRDSLTITDPEWDVALGTLEYKILEAVAREISTVQNQGIVSDYHWDIDAKSGRFLDRFVEMFGMNRLPARRASGDVVFSRGTPATQEIVIPRGVQIYRPGSSVGPQVIFQTVAAGSILTGQTTVTVPAEAIIAGASGNVSSGSISGFGTAVSDVTSVTNPVAMTGGRDPETDEQLRSRWRRTAFRGITGTKDAYISTCLEHDQVSKAALVEASNFSFEQLEVSSSEVVSQIPDIKFVYDASTLLLGSASESIGFGIGTPAEDLGVRDTDYTFDPGPPATFTITSAKFENGDVVDVVYEYVPESSRNSPPDSVHFGDIFVSGTNAVSVTEQRAIDTSIVFTNTGDHTSMNQDNWQRIDGSSPTVDNILMVLAAVPLDGLPSSIQEGVDTYVLGTDYFLVRDVTVLGGSVRCRDGIEWVDGLSPANGTVLTINYTTNLLIRRLQDLIERIRTVGSDVLVHRALYWFARIHLAVVLERTSSLTSTADQVEAEVIEWINGKGFADNIQIADLIDVVKNVAGVDNVRLTNSTESPSAYGIEHLAEDGTTVLATHTSDVYLNHNELPVLNQIVITHKALNTF